MQIDIDFFQTELGMESENTTDGIDLSDLQSFDGDSPYLPRQDMPERRRYITGYPL